MTLEEDFMELETWMSSSDKGRSIERFLMESGLDPWNLWLWSSLVHWSVDWKE